MMRRAALAFALLRLALGRVVVLDGRSTPGASGGAACDEAAPCLPVPCAATAVTSGADVSALVEAAVKAEVAGLREALLRDVEDRVAPLGAALAEARAEYAAAERVVSAVAAAAGGGGVAPNAVNNDWRGEVAAVEIRLRVEVERAEARLREGSPMLITSRFE